jgi:CHAT domain-containing protein
MDLSSTDLVVLSACETGLGEVQSGEGLLGLQRGFRIAGAKSIIMTLWDISDAVTSEVMLYFYQNFLEGQSHAEALKNAIQEIRKKYPEPYYWGGFILNGT